MSRSFYAYKAACTASGCRWQVIYAGPLAKRYADTWRTEHHYGAKGQCDGPVKLLGTDHPWSLDEPVYEEIA